MHSWGQPRPARLIPPKTITGHRPGRRTAPRRGCGTAAPARPRHRTGERSGTQRGDPRPAAPRGRSTCNRPAGDPQRGPVGSTLTRSIFRCAIRVRAPLPCAPSCVPSYVQPVCNLCAIPCAPLPCERRPHEHHTRPRLTLLFCTHWCPGDREKLRAPQLPRCSPGADTELFTSIHPLGGRRRPSPHPVPPVRRGAARSAPACRQSEEPGTPPRPGPAHPRLRAVPVPPPPLPVAVTAGWIGAAAPGLSPAGFCAARCNFRNRHQKYRPPRGDLKAVGARK